jgi:hypothetical protein
MAKRIWQLPCLILYLFIVLMGCTTSQKSEGSDIEPYPKQDISGVWLGYFFQFSPTQSEIFSIGIITTDDYEHYYARFIGDNNQYISPDGSPLVQTAGTAIFLGYLEDCAYITEPDYSSENRSLSLSATASTKRAFGDPLFTFYTDSSQEEFGSFTFIYNTTYDVSPNVNDISGKWEIKNAFKGGNTLVLTIAPNIADTKGTTISGQDDRGNTFNGTIEIHYTPSSPKNVYDVNLTLNDSQLLEGLATFVLEVHTMGPDHPINIDRKTLAIGATNKEKTFSLNGFATEKK